MLLATSMDLRCGISSTWELLGGCPRCMSTALHTGNFSGPWTNHNTLPRIDTLLDTHEHTAASSFVPTLFGAGALTGEVTRRDVYRQRKGHSLTRPWFRAEQHFLQHAPAVLGWHRPDLFTITNTHQTAGNEPLRDSRAEDDHGSPRAARHWQAMIQNLTTHHKAYYGTKSHTRIVAPLVGVDRSGFPSRSGNVTPPAPSPRAPCTFPRHMPGEAHQSAHDERQSAAFWRGRAHQRACDGWLADFKRSTLRLPCVSPAGEPSRVGAQQVLMQVEEYAAIFADDVAGINGRSRKTLWLTEVVVASAELGEILPFVAALMDPVDGLRNRRRFWYVEVVAWKHAHWVDSRAHPTNPPPSVPGAPAAATRKREEKELWVSSLFDAFGDLTPLGASFFGRCPPGMAVPRAAAASAAVSAAVSAVVQRQPPPPPPQPPPEPTRGSAPPLQCGVATGFFVGCRSCGLAALATGKLSRWYNWALAPIGFLDAKTPRQMRARFMPMRWGPKLLEAGEAPSLRASDMPPWLLALLNSTSAEFSFFNEPDAYGPACDGLAETPANACGRGEFAPPRALGGVSAPRHSPRASMFDPVTSAPLCCAPG